MSSSPAQLPSPCPTTTFDRDSSVPPDQKPVTSAFRMIKIDSLLNPSASVYSRLRQASVSPPPTPAYTTGASSTTSTPQPQTPTTSSSVLHQKLIKDGAVFLPGTPKEPVNYPPYESTDPALCLSPADRAELARQHVRFEVYPRGEHEQDLIANYQRHIPYTSERTKFTSKTNLDAFEVFTYTFRVSEDEKKHVVLWDYQNGLVRITPFFKALKYSKTTPAKALNTNAGLKKLSHSITGGALVAQGYWMPYSCARAICLTFCYPIRWALTPIFGPSFVKECLRPEHPHFARFLVCSEVIRCAEREAEGLGSKTSSCTTSPATNHSRHDGAKVDIPRSVPAPVEPVRQLRPKKEQPTFKQGSPFDSESEVPEYSEYTRVDNEIESPALSPKSTPRASDNPSWTTVNRHHHRQEGTPSSPLHQSPYGALARSLLTKPHFAPTTSWRGASSPSSTPKAVKMPTGAHDKHRTHKRRISDRMAEADTDRTETMTNRFTSGSPADSDDDIVVPPAASRKRKRRIETPAPPAVPSTSSIPSSSNKSTKYTATDFDAAHWLVNLSVRDSQLALGPAQMRGLKRRASPI